VGRDTADVYPQQTRDVDHLKCMQTDRLTDWWAQLNQDTINKATDMLPKCLEMFIQGNGGHVEFRLD